MLTTTFPRWQHDTTPQFVFQLSNRLGKDYKMVVLAPHYPKSSKQEKMDLVDVRRFAYFKPESLQKLCYDGGIIPNLKKSLLAKIQLPLLLQSEFFSAKKLIGKERPSLIHAHWVLPQGLIGAFLKEKFNIPLIITIHGSDLFPLKNSFFRKLQHYALTHADIITVNSDATKKELLSRFPTLIKKVRLIPMGVDVSHFKPRAVKKPEWFKDNKIILFVGRLSDQKGVQHLIGALPTILDKEPKAKLLIIGEGPYKQQLESVVFSSNVGHAVHFLGGLPQEDIAYYCNIADAFVLPALSTASGTEALGLSLLEAMASGCAVIGTNIGGIPSIISHGNNGVLVEQKNQTQLTHAILGLFKNRKKSALLGKRATAFVRKNYSWETSVRSFGAVYREVAP